MACAFVWRVKCACDDRQAPFCVRSPNDVAIQIANELQSRDHVPGSPFSCVVVRGAGILGCSSVRACWRARPEPEDSRRGG